MDVNLNDVLSGTGGRAWWNGNLIGSLIKCEMKMSGDFEDINICGDAATHSIFNGWNGSGTLSWLKTDSKIVDQLIQAYTSGVMPDIQIVTALTNQRTKKSSRYQVGGITVDEFTVTSFEAKKNSEEEIPFKFSSIRVLESI